MNKYDTGTFRTKFMCCKILKFETVKLMKLVPNILHILLEIIFIFQVFQGLLRANKTFHDTKASMTRLWIHECFRYNVYKNKLIAGSFRVSSVIDSGGEGGGGSMVFREYALAVL